MVAKKPTFKKEPRATGLLSVAEPDPDTQIKLAGQLVGYIRPPHYSDDHRLWSVALMATEVGTTSWKWIRFAKKHASEPDARQWLLDNWDKITAKYTLYSSKG